MSVQEFNVIEWLNAFTPAGSLDAQDSVLHFPRMWNLFEAVACNKHASNTSIEAVVNALHSDDLLSREDFSYYAEYFRNRYLQDGHENERFDQLKFYKNEDKQFVASALMDETKPTNDLVSALLMIVYRYRNNLFHGEKWLYNLHNQSENFQVANQLLARVLELLLCAANQYDCAPPTYAVASRVRQYLVEKQPT